MQSIVKNLGISVVDQDDYRILDDLRSITEEAHNSFSSLVEFIKRTILDKSRTILDIESDIINVSNDLHKLVLKGTGMILGDPIIENIIIKQYKKMYRNFGIELVTHRTHKTSIMTSKGQIQFSRRALRPKTDEHRSILKLLTGKKMIFPLDESIKISNLPFKITPKAMVRIAYCCASELSYNAATARLAEDNGIYITSVTARAVTDYIGHLINMHDQDEANNIFNNRSKINFTRDKNFVLYIMPDGSMIHTRDKAEQGGSWHEDKLGIVFSSEFMELKSEINGVKHYKINKMEYVNYFGGVDIFQKLLFATAIRNGYGEHKSTVFISDGAKWIANMRELLFPDAIHILDFWHLCQYIYDFAKLLYNNKKEKYEKWVENIKDNLLNGNKDDVLQEILNKEKSLASKRNLKLKDGTNYKIGTLSNYIRANYDKINYLDYRKKGLYIGSGHIESGNKTVVQERCKRAGMRWNINSAQNILSLRVKLKSNLWYQVYDIVSDLYNLNRLPYFITS